MAFGDGNSCTLRALKNKRNFSGEGKGFANCKSLQEKTEIKRSGSKRADVFSECGLYIQTQIKGTRKPRRCLGASCGEMDLGRLGGRGKWAKVSSGVCRTQDLPTIPAAANWLFFTGLQLQRAKSVKSPLNCYKRSFSFVLARIRVTFQMII